MAKQRSRFIPASAGNTLPLLVPVPAFSVHPRERGEHAFIFDPFINNHGSSPRARGTPTTNSSTSNFGRFIPASAGNTISITIRSMASAVHPRERGEHGIGGIVGAPDTVHPRERGEHFFFSYHCFYWVGSSPRARGTHFEHTLDSITEFKPREFYQLQLVKDRYCPAQAGSSRASRHPTQPASAGSCPRSRNRTQPHCSSAKP